MNESFDLQAYLTKGVEKTVSEILKATFQNPKESAFMLRFAAASKAASAKRKAKEKEGEHIPPFLVASITSSCNLHCAHCYSRCVNATVDAPPEQQLTDEEWAGIFDEADSLGISFIILIGGEPLLRKGVLKAAGKKQSILFPVFTNGTFLSEDYFTLFDQCRNLIPIMSIEGDLELTDQRRGEGIYQRLMANMEELKKRGLIFGTSFTVTTENYREILSEDYIRELSDKGCKAMIFVEFVPVSEDSAHLAPGEEEREFIRSEIQALRSSHPEMVFVSFPGDEKSSGGCIAAGRGFFHINSHGDAEPCPFSPYSDINVKDTSLKEAMHSALFESLRKGDVLADDHKGGCVLYEKKAEVEALLA